MAMMCCMHGGECNGCGRCQPEPEYIDKCHVCGWDITSDEDYYDLEDVKIHEECLSEWAEKYLVRSCAV